MRHMPLSLLILLLTTLPAVPAAFAFADDDEGDRVIYADSPKDRYEAKLELLENQAEARRAQCRGSGIGGRNYCTQEIEKDLRTKKRDLKLQYEAELAKSKKDQ